MHYAQIGRMPRTLTREVIESESSCKGWHESLLRSFHIVQKVKWLLEKGTAPEIVLELILLMESTELEPYAMAEGAYKFERLPGVVKAARE
jgi:hypothetical protein